MKVAVADSMRLLSLLEEVDIATARARLHGDGVHHAVELCVAAQLKVIC